MSRTERTKTSKTLMLKHVIIGRNPKIGRYVILGEGYSRSRGIGKLVIGDNAVVRSHSVIYAGNKIGNNFQTGHGVLIRENNQIGNDVSIGTHSVIERDNRIEDRVRIHSNCFVPEFVQIHENAWIGPSVTILNVLHPPCPKFELCAKSVVIRKNAKIGGNVTIGPRVTIGENAVIGCGAVVVNDVPDDSVAVGSPARVIKRTEELKCLLGYFKVPYEWEKDTKRR
jgi:acetyltransferase-like isoleucine patch superfamily enzyme